MKSVWSEKSNLPSFESLSGKIKTDVLVIGGGLAGILCAYLLTRQGVDCVLVESSTICSGATKNTSAKITSQHGLIYDKLIKEFGKETARLYLEANQVALEKYRGLCKEIACGFEAKDSYVYSLSSRDKIEKELSALSSIGFTAELADKLPLPFQVAGAVKFKNQAQFNPLQFVSAIAPSLRIYENTPVREMEKHTAITPNGSISAEKIIAATHFPFINKHGSYFVKLYQHRSYVIALKNAPNVDGMYVDEAEKGLSFRNYGDLLLLGGGDHRTGKQGGCWNELESFAREHYSFAEIKYRWAAQDCMSLDAVPYIGRYSKSMPDLFVASGFNKWGMSTSMLAALLLTDLVQGKENKYAQVFSPSRTILHPQLAVNAFEALTNLLTPSKKRCPHMGCALKWNEQEHSWDCCCHGSRFSEDGQLIDNPATSDLKHSD